MQVRHLEVVVVVFVVVVGAAYSHMYNLNCNFIVYNDHHDFIRQGNDTFQLTTGYRHRYYRHGSVFFLEL